MINKIIRNFIAKQMAGRSDDGIMITLRDPQKVELGENIMADLLMRNGIDPRAITSEAQLKNILNQIEAASKQTTSGIRNTKSAKVFDLEGKEIPKGSKIMGGKAIDDDLPPPGSRGGDEDIAAPVQSSEETLKNMIMAENKKNIAAMKKRKMLDDAIENQSPGLTGDRKYDADIVAEDLAERMGLVYDDMPTKERLDLYDKAYQALTKKKFDPPEDLATGGRVGLKGGADAATESFSKSAGSSRPGRKGSVSISPSGNVTFNPGGKDDGPVDKSTFEQTINQMKPPKKQKSGLEKIFDAGQEFNYLKNLAIGNFPGIGKQLLLNYGKQKLLDDQAMLDTEEDQNMMLADLTDMQKKMLEGPQKNLKDIMGISNEEILQNIEKFNNPDAPATIQDIEQFYQQARDGGIMRLGFKDGMNRRTFMKIFTGLVSLPIIGKVLKPLKVGKTVTKVPIIKTDNIAGKPEWFDQLVNKVILEGDDMTKQFATKEREIVHATKIGKDDYVRVTQDLDEGAVRVEYESLDNMYEDPVQLRYKKPNPDEGDPRPSAEFDVAESGPVGRADGPDDYSIDIDEVGGTSISDLTSDVSKLKEYATGQKPTLKEIVQTKRRKDKARRITEGGEAEMDAVIERQGEFIENDLVDLDPPDLASGGIARMLGE
jgi:hypothetical protein